MSGGQKKLCACGHRENRGASTMPVAADPDSAVQKHNKMVDPIADCPVMIAGGMGYGAYQALTSRNMKVFITAESSIKELLNSIPLVS